MADILSLDNARTLLASWFPDRDTCITVSLWQYNSPGMDRQQRANYRVSILPGLHGDDCTQAYAPTLGLALDAAERLRDQLYGDEEVDLADPAGEAGYTAKDGTGHATDQDRPEHRAGNHL